MDNYFEKNNSSIISLLLCFMFEIQMLLFQREKNETNSLTVSSWDEGTQPLTFLWAVNFVVGTRITCLIHWIWFYFNTATITWMLVIKIFSLKKKPKKVLSYECNPIQDMSFGSIHTFFFFQTVLCWQKGKSWLFNGLGLNLHQLFHPACYWGRCNIWREFLLIVYDGNKQCSPTFYSI
jgi:hypothetical protein